MTQMTQELRILEAILFAATDPMTEDDLGLRLPQGSDVPALLEQLRRHYDGHGIGPTRLDGKWMFRTAPDLAALLQIENTVSRKPSRAAVETLAIIAYHQPITRTEVEQIRGVGVSRGSFDVLLEAGWIRPVGRRRTPGRPMTWGTTGTFLQHFGLDQLADLPGVDDLKASGLLDTRPAAMILSKSPNRSDEEGEEEPSARYLDTTDEEDPSALREAEDA